MVPTWQDYLFPDVSNVFAVARPPEITVTLNQRASTKPFAPSLYKPDLPPASAKLRSDLPRMMRLGLERLLEESGQRQSKIPAPAADRVHAILRNYSQKSDLSTLAIYIGDAVETINQALFNDPTHFRFLEAQATSDCAVFWRGDRESFILWESKSPTVGEIYMDRLVSSGSISFPAS